MRVKRTLLNVLSIILLTSSGVFAANLDKAKTLFTTTCMPCHMPDGEGNKLYKSPNIAGQNNWYLSAQLKKFKDGIRGLEPRDHEGLMMVPMSRILKTEDELTAMSEYLSSLSGGKAKHHMSDGDPKKGEVLFLVCKACHGEKAQGIKEIGTPKLAVLADWYIFAQLKKLQDGTRGANVKDVGGMQMRPMSKTLESEQAIHNVIAYIKTLGK